MTKLREEKEKKRKSAKAREIIETIGEEGKKGRRAAKEYFKDQAIDAEKETSVEMELLSKTKKLDTYNTLLAKLLLKRLRFVDFPDGWSCEVAPTEVGIIMELQSPDKKFYRTGFKPVWDPMYDLNAVETYAVRAENTIDRWAGTDMIKDSGLILPHGQKRKVN